MTKIKLTGGLVAAAALLLPALGAAQTMDPALQPLGVRAGAFLIHPSLGASGAYDDNIFADDSDEEDDLIFTLRPGIRAESQWSRHRLVADAFGEFGFYRDNDDSNYEDFGTSLSGRLDVLRNSYTTGTISIARLHDDRDDPDESGEEEVTQYWRSEARLAHRHNFVRFFVQPSVFAQRLSFDSAGDISNTTRDRDRYGIGVRAGYALSPRVALFVETNGDKVVYDDSGEFDRDSTGFDVRGGAEIDISRLVVGEASIGYARREYEDDDVYSDVNGVAGDLGIVWTPTQLTTVNFTGSVGVDESTIVYEGERAAGNLATDLGIGVAHALRRNIVLNADVAYERDNFRGTDRVDNTYRIGGGVTYLINRNFSVDARYDFATRDSDDDNAEYDRNIFRVGVTARL